MGSFNHSEDFPNESCGNFKESSKPETQHFVDFIPSNGRIFQSETVELGADLRGKTVEIRRVSQKDSDLSN